MWEGLGVEVRALRQERMRRSLRLADYWPDPTHLAPGWGGGCFTFDLGGSSWWKQVAAAAKSLQSCPTLCNPIDGSPPGSPIPGIPRTLEWVAISFSSAWKWKNKVKSLSRVQLLVTPWTAAHEASPSMGFSRQEYWSRVPSPSPENKLSSRQMVVRVHSQQAERRTVNLSAVKQHHSGCAYPFQVRLMVSTCCLVSCTGCRLGLRTSWSCPERCQLTKLALSIFFSLWWKSVWLF